MLRKYVWFQNRRAKFRRQEKQDCQGEEKHSLKDTMPSWSWMSENKTDTPPMLPPANTLSSTHNNGISDEFFKTSEGKEVYGFPFAEYGTPADNTHVSKTGNVFHLNFEDSDKKSMKKESPQTPSTSSPFISEYHPPFIPYYIPNQSFSNAFNQYPMPFPYPIHFEPPQLTHSQENC